MRVVGWSNGTPNQQTGAGYGVKVSHVDRDQYFQRDWSSVTVRLGDAHSVTVNLSPSFWNKCSELRSQEIGMWMLARRLAPWPKGKPPVMDLTPAGPRQFSLLQGT